MHAWEQIQKTVDYLEDHLNEEVNIDELAKMASLSPFYYQRLFHRLVKKPVGEYVKLRRMARAMELLRQDDQRILDIALELGFASHEHFTRTFKETFAMTPEEYRKHPATLNRMTKPELLLHYTLVDEGIPLITEGLVIEVNCKKIEQPVHFVGYKMDLPFSFLQELGVNSGEDPLYVLWQNFHDDKETMLGLNIDAEELGVTYSSTQEGYFTYFAGGRSDSMETPDNAISYDLPEGEYVVCSFEAENFEALVMDALYKAQNYVYNTWLANKKIQTEAFCAERYASHSPETKSMEFWLKVKRP